MADEAAKLLDEKAAAKLNAEQKRQVAKSMAKAKEIVDQATAAAAQAQIDAAVAAGKAQLAARQAIANAKAAEGAAKQQLAEIAATDAKGGKAFQTAKALKQLQAGDGWADLSAVQQLEQVQAKAAELIAAQAKASALSTYKTAVLAGKTPPPAAVTAVTVQVIR